jgi:hypothetical protein
MHTLPLTLALLCAGPAHAVDVRTSAFGSFDVGGGFGPAPDAEAVQRFEDFGDSEVPLQTQRAFGIVGTDFVVVADLDDK